MQICRSHPTFIRLSLRDFKWGHESKVFTFECPVLNSSQFILGKPNYGHIVISTCYLKKIANLQQHPISFPITASGCFSMLLIFFLAINRLETSYLPQSYPGKKNPFREASFIHFIPFTSSEVKLISPGLFTLLKTLLLGLKKYL